MRGDSAIVFRSSTIDAAWSECIGGLRIVCYDCGSCGEVSERLKELASKASVGGTLPWVQIPPSPPYHKNPMNRQLLTFVLRRAKIWRVFHRRHAHAQPEDPSHICAGKVRKWLA